MDGGEHNFKRQRILLREPQWIDLEVIERRTLHGKLFLCYRRQMLV